MHLILNYKLKYEDKLNYQYYMFKKKNKSFKPLNLIIQFLPLFFILFSFIYVNLAMHLFVGFLIIIIYISWLVKKSIFISYKKSISNYDEIVKKNNQIENKELKINENEIIISDNFSTSKLKWDIFNKFEISPNYYFLQIFDGSAIIIPKNEITDNVTLNNFLELCKKKLNST